MRQIICVFIAGSFLCGKVLAEIPGPLEPEYSEAVLAYNAKDYESALKILNQLLQKAPELPEALELKALTLRTKKDDVASVETYQKLIEVKKKENRPPKEIAPYQFELGLIKYREKKIAEAKQHFEYSLREGFNDGVCYLYLGLFAFQSGDWNSAGKNFKGVLSSNADDLKPAAHFYLAQTFLKTEYPTGATQSLIAARNTSEALMENRDTSEDAKKVASQIHEATRKALEPFDHGQFFANAGLLMGYDSNVLAVPSSVSASAAALGRGSVKTTLVGGAGYTTSPLKQFQIVPSYKGSANRNWSEDTKTGEYASNIFSLFITRFPIAATSYGIKGEASYIFRNDYDTTLHLGTFRYFLNSYTFGPYIRHELKPKMLLGGEVFVTPKNYRQDPSSGDQQRSGTESNFRAYLSNDQGDRWINPSGSVRLTSDDAKGSEYKSTTYGFQLSNILHIAEKLTVSPALDFALSKYSSRPTGARIDRTWTAQAVATYRISARLSGLGSLEYVKDSSSIADTYSFDRTSMNFGITYTF